MWQVDILNDGLVLVPLRFGWIARCENRCARVQLTNDARLCDAECALLHDFVKDASCAVAHLIELIDAANTVVGEDE